MYFYLTVTHSQYYFSLRFLSEIHSHFSLCQELILKIKLNAIGFQNILEVEINLIVSFVQQLYAKELEKVNWCDTYSTFSYPAI